MLAFAQPRAGFVTPMTRLIKSSAKKSGLAPGTLVYTGDKMPQTVRLSLMRYDAQRLQEKPFVSVAELLKSKPEENWGVTWLDIDGLNDAAAMEAIGKRFDLHPLILEDILNAEQRPKMVDYGDWLFIVLKMLSFDDKTRQVKSEQLSIVLGRDSVISFQEIPGDVLEPVRNRIRNGIGRIRKVGADYLAYALVDAVVDHYFVILEKLGEKIEELEDTIVQNPSSKSLQDIHALKREVIYLRRSVWPLRDVIDEMDDLPSTLLQQQTEIYLRDLDDHVVRVIEIIETYRDTLASVLEIYLSSISYKMNTVMKVLTIIATIFIPLTFVVGIYGMNFDNMPELHWAWGYPTVMAAMFLMTMGMLSYFKKKDWL